MKGRYALLLCGVDTIAPGSHHRFSGRAQCPFRGEGLGVAGDGSPGFDLFVVSMSIGNTRQLESALPVGVKMLPLSLETVQEEDYTHVDLRSARTEPATVEVYVRGFAIDNGKRAGDVVFLPLADAAVERMRKAGYVFALKEERGWPA